MQKIKKLLYLILFVMSSFILVNRAIAASYPFEGMIDADALVIKDGIDSKANKVTELVFGSKVTVTGESGSFYKITFDNDKQGYASKSYVINVKQYASTSGDYRSYCDGLISKGFVEAYCPQLYYLHMAYPNWTFTPDVTGLTLEEVSKKEEDKSVLATGNSNYYLRDKPIEDDYYYIKANVIASFMDPRNVMYSKRIFQYLDLQSSKDIVNDAAMAKVVGSGNLKNYFAEYKKAALTHNINPLHILVRSWQEGANKATYSAVTGLYTTNSGRTSHQGFSLDGYYNFYNIGSYQTSTYPYTVQRGLAYGAGFLEDDKCMTTNTETGITVYDSSKCGELSYQRPWNTQERAIVGGAEFIANGYVRKGQDTLYYQKFNVSSRHQYTLYTHQYMTNIMAPNDEGKRLYEAYEAGGLLNSKFNFIIPVYKDLAGKSAQPVDKNGDATLKEIKINGNLIAGFDKDVVEYPYSLQTNNDSFDVTATANTPLTKVTGTGKYTFNNGSVVVSIKTTAEDGTNKTYTVTVKQVKIANEVKVKDVTDKLNVKVDGTVIFGIKPGMTAQELINSVSSANGKAVLTDANGNNKSSGKLATGDIITISGTNDKQSFTVSVVGDISGDGKINALDLLKCQKQILKISELNNVQKLSSDTNFDGKINALDLLRIQKHILGMSTL